MVNLTDIPAWDLDTCKARQKVVRRKITSLHIRVNAIVTGGLFRRDAEKHLNEARTFLGELEVIHDRMIELLDEVDDAAVNTQTTQHQTYANHVDSASSLVENYLILRQNDPISVIDETPEEIARREALQTAEQRLRDARAELEEAEKAYVDLGGDITSPDKSEIGPSDSASQVGARPAPKAEHYPTGPSLPADAWIDLAVSSRI